jgi:hypothetical protein
MNHSFCDVPSSQEELPVWKSSSHNVGVAELDTVVRMSACMRVSYEKDNQDHLSYHHHRASPSQRMMCSFS